MRQLIKIDQTKLLVLSMLKKNYAFFLSANETLRHIFVPVLRIGRVASFIEDWIESEAEESTSFYLLHILTSDSVRKKMGDELTNLFEIFKRIEKNGGQATLFVSTNAGKTKVKLELTSCSPNKTHLCQVLQLWETSAAVIAARQRRLKPMLEQPCTRQPWPLQLLQLWGMMKNLHHLLLPLLPTPRLHHLFLLQQLFDCWQPRAEHLESGPTSINLTGWMMKNVSFVTTTRWLRTATWCAWEASCTKTILRRL